MRTWVNGAILTDAEQPVLSALDHGITVGDGVFETVNSFDGVPFALTRHLHRMSRSAAGLGLPDPDHGVLRDAVAQVLEGTSYARGRIRLTQTGGPGPAGTDRGDAGPTLIVTAGPQAPSADTTTVTVVPWTRNERAATAGLKTTSYADNVIALTYARERTASEAIFANTQGMLCEGTGSNLFYVVDGDLVTPTLASGCLAGITRELVLQWCGALERDAPVEVLEQASEVFVVSTTRDVQPVHACERDGRSWTYDAPGPSTSRAREIWSAKLAEMLDP